MIEKVFYGGKSVLQVLGKRRCQNVRVYLNGRGVLKNWLRVLVTKGVLKVSVEIDGIHGEKGGPTGAVQKGVLKDIHME